MKKIVKIAVIAVVVILAIALIAPAALRGKIADIVKREANAMLAARLDFEKLDISLLRHLDVYKRQDLYITISKYESSLYKTGTGGLRSCGGSRVCNLAARRGGVGSDFGGLFG